MKMKIFVSLIFGFMVAVLVTNPVHADGIIIPEPIPLPEPLIHPMVQLEIKYHHVDVEIIDQIAVTHVDQVFYNPNDWAVEGTYVFPLPTDAVVSDFTLWIDGEPVQGEVLDAEKAREIYEDIVRKMQDPALLEYIGRGALQASIFPIPPGGERRIELKYTQALTADNGLVRYVYPLNTEKFSAQPLESVSVSVHITSSQPIRAAYSPSHLVDITRKSSEELTAGYEEEDVIPDKDFALYYSIGDSQAFHLFTYRDPNDEEDKDGFFMLMLAPSPIENVEVVSKDVLLILDKSGSMEGEKFQQAQAALRYIIEHLNPEDRFFITSFSTSIETYSRSLRPASEAQDALKWVDGLSAAGSTDVNRALLETIDIADREKPTYLIFLTDGLPTEGVTDSQMILTNFDQNAPDNVRLFTFGVGYDVDTFLLDSLSQEHHGLSTYVQPGEKLDEILSAFYARISTPVLTNIELDFGDLAVYDLYPQPLPDLFVGTQVIVVGRYRLGGTTDVTLTGDVNGVSQKFNFDNQVFARDNRGENVYLAGISRLWATRKIGYLLSSIRLNGPDQETIDQIVKLSIRYGIVTPYTSYLVTEPMPLGASNQQDLARDVYEQSLAAPTMVSGQAAVEKAAEEGQLAQAEIAPSSNIAYENVQTIWSRSFILTNGVWMDTAYDPEQMLPMKIAFLSPEYFELAQSRPDVSAALALGNHVILVIDGQAYEITSAGESDSNLQMPETIASPTARNEPDQTPTQDEEQNQTLTSPSEPASQPTDTSLTSGGGKTSNISIYTILLLAGGLGMLILIVITLRSLMTRK